jgi:hypothetical protein
MNKIGMLAFLGFFSISSAKNSVKLESLKMKAGARYQKEIQKCESETIKLGMAFVAGGAAFGLFALAMGNGGLLETPFMQQMVGNFNMGLYAFLGLGTIELGIGMYMTMKGLSAIQYYQNAVEILKQKETLITIINNKKSKRKECLA